MLIGAVSRSGELKAAVESQVHAALPILQTIFEAQENGLLLVMHGGTVVAANAAMGAMLGIEADEVIGISPEKLMDYLSTIVDEVPELLRARQLFPLDRPLVGEELEILRPSRSVIRWVTTRVVLQGEVGWLVHCTDITSEVDLVAAQQKLAATDRLTGLLNRRGIEPAIARSVATVRRSGAPLSFLLIDIDHFKKVNDVHGHGAGDEVLKRVSAVLAGALRDCDLLARWGGEEFLVMLTDCSLQGAKICAERVRAAVEACEIPTGKVTVSIGAAQFDGIGAVATIETADKRLYEAKATGRNRVC